MRSRRSSGLSSTRSATLTSPERCRTRAPGARRTRWPSVHSSSTWSITPRITAARSPLCSPSSVGPHPTPGSTPSGPPSSSASSWRGGTSAMGMKELVEELRARRQRALAMGGAVAIAKQHAEGKLTVRERIDQDVPGFLVGSKVERQGIIRHGAKMLYAVSEATVPKLTVVLRKAYGAGYFVMCGKAYEPDLIVAWPTAEISVMGPEGGTNIVYRKEIAAAANPDEERARRVEDFRNLISPYIAAGAALIDDVIDPRETRPILIRALEMAKTKRVDRPWRKHGVMPV